MNDQEKDVVLKEAQHILEMTFLHLHTCQTCFGYGKINGSPAGPFAIAGGDDCPDCKKNGGTAYQRAMKLLKALGTEQ